MKPHFTILICSRNDSPEQVTRCLQAALSQDYPDYAVMWMDDASESLAGWQAAKVTVNPLSESREVVAGHELDDEDTGCVHYVSGPQSDTKFNARVYRGSRREYALKRYVDIVRHAESLYPNTIILCHGGDDCLAGPHVLARIAKEYEDGAWFTYGQYRQFPSNKVGRCVPFPPEVLTNRQVRNHPFISMHPTTFYAKLFLKIREEHLKINGRWIDTAADTHIHFPILEMCGKPERVHFIDEVLYYYQEQDPKRFISEEYALQCFMHWNSRHLPRYSTLETLDDEPTVEKHDPSDWGLICETRKKVYDAKLAQVEAPAEEKPEAT